MSTFLLGVGAQKAGTTWLHRYIQSSESTDLGFAKEYHIWDALNCPECARFRVESRLPLRPNKFRRWRMQRNPDYYFNYFKRLLTRDGVELTGDITPSYSCLSSYVFEQIHAACQARGMQLKVVFLMRDPVQRCWSAVRMHRRKGKTRDDVDLRAEEEEAVLRYYQSPNARIRTRYDWTIQALEAAIPRQNLFYGLYEELFCEAEIDRLSSFLGLESRHEFADNRFNISKPQSALGDETARRIAEEYREVYQFCAARLPQIRQIWSGYQYL